LSPRLDGSSQPASQGVPDSLLPQAAYEAKYPKNDILSGLLKGDSSALMQGVPQDQKASGNTFGEDLEEANAKKEQPEEEAAKEEDSSEEPVTKKEEAEQSSAPKDVQEAIKKVEDPDNSLESYKDAHDDYGIDDLQDVQQKSRKAASALLGVAAFQESMGNALGRKMDTSALRGQAQNELGKAQDYQRLLNEQRAEMTDDMRSDAADISHQKALMQMSSEKSMNDPDSDISKSARATLASLAQQTGMNININDKMPYTAIIKLFPPIEKYVQSSLMAKSREEIAKQRGQLQQVLLQDKLEKKADSDFGKQIASPRYMSPEARQASMDDYFGSKAQELIAPYLKNPDKMTPQQFNTLKMEIAKLAAGGKASQAEMAALDPNTLAGGISKITQMFSNAPANGNYGKFIKQYGDYVNSLRNNAKSSLYKHYKTMLDAAPSTLADSDRQKYMSTYVDRYKPEESNLVKVLDPQGNIRAVPRDQLDAAIKAKGKLVE